MAKCSFCGRGFKTKQSVRAHLRHCDAYQERAPQPGPLKAGLPIGKRAYIGRDLPKAAKGAGFDPAAHVRSQVEAAEGELRLRQLKAAQGELDQKGLERSRLARQEAETERRRKQEEAQARRQAELEAEERREKEEAEREGQRRRREIIQDVKDRAVRGWWSVKYRIPAETQARALKEIENELSGLRVEELPEQELIEIAEGIRDRLYRPVMAAQDEAKEREEERERQESTRAFEKSMAKLQETVKSIRLDREKDKMVSYADSFASEELDERGIRPSFERYAILEKVKDELRKKLTGEETKAEIEDVVEKILEESFEKP